MQENTWGDHFIAFLLSAKSTKLYRKNLWASARVREKNLSSEAFNQYIYRLRKKGIIETKNDRMYVCRDNLLKFLVKNNSVMKNVVPDKTEKLLISFDIPETKKKARDWLRNQLKFWKFEMVHKSLWLGWGPLPKEFKSRLRRLKIDSNIRIFRLKKPI